MKLFITCLIIPFSLFANTTQDIVCRIFVPDIIEPAQFGFSPGFSSHLFSYHEKAVQETKYTPFSATEVTYKDRNKQYLVRSLKESVFQPLIIDLNFSITAPPKYMQIYFSQNEYHHSHTYFFFTASDSSFPVPFTLFLAKDLSPVSKKHFISKQKKIDPTLFKQSDLNLYMYIPPTQFPTLDERCGSYKTNLVLVYESS